MIILGKIKINKNTSSIMTCICNNCSISPLFLTFTVHNDLISIDTFFLLFQSPISINS
jgi:hypothetical protein